MREFTCFFSITSQSLTMETYSEGEDSTDWKECYEEV